MDCTVSTGAAAMMAVRVLLVGAPDRLQVHVICNKLLSSCSLFSWMCFYLQDHDVQEDKILLVSLLMAEMGVHSVAYAFPQVKIITTAVDKKVNDLFHIIPGIGEQWRKDALFIHDVSYYFMFKMMLTQIFCHHRKLRGSILRNRCTTWLERRRDGWAQLLIQLLFYGLWL